MLATLLLSFGLTVGSSEAATVIQPPDQPAGAVSAAVDETQPVDVPPATEKALQYRASGNILWALDQVWSMLVLAVLLATGFSARLRDWSRRIGRTWFFTLAVYFILFTTITSIIDLPRVYYVEFVREHAYGLSNQTLQKWWTDTLTSLGVACLIGPLVIWVPYLLLRKSPTRWWLYSAVALIPFIVAGNLIAPIWIAPLFNKFEPMRDKALETRILALADRAGIEGSRVFQVNKSVDTKTINACVAGMFNTKRVVLWDTIIGRMNERELMFVMGHEMGHYALGHVWQSVALSSIAIMLSFYGAYRTAGAVLSRYRARFGFSTLSDIASLPLLFALTSAFSFVTTPGELAFTRHVEHEADRFGLEIIDFANDYRPWRNSQPLVYGDRFKRGAPSARARRDQIAALSDVERRDR